MINVFLRLKEKDHLVKREKIKTIKDRFVMRSTYKKSLQYIDEVYKKDKYNIINEVLKNNAGKGQRLFNTLPDTISLSLDEDMFEYLKKHELIQSTHKSVPAYGAGQSMTLPYERSFVDKRYRGKYTGQGINVAILDTGMAYHEDLPYVSSFNDFVNGRSYQYDDNLHGTFLAGIIAAQDNDTGIIGMAPDVNLYIGKVLNNNGYGTSAQIAAGLDWAFDNDVDVINLSVSFPHNADYADIEPVIRLLDNVNYYGSIIVSCSGNGTMTIPPEGGTYYWDYDGVGEVTLPAYNDDCIAVGSIDNSTNERSDFSNYGDGLDFIHYGNNVPSLWYKGGTAVGSGTSYATAQVAGLIAALWSKYPASSRLFIINSLNMYSQSMGNEWEYGQGLPVAEGPDLPSVKITSPSNNEVVSDYAIVKVEASNSIAYVNFYCDQLPSNKRMVTDNTYPFEGTLDFSDMPEGTYTISVRGYTSDGESTGQLSINVRRSFAKPILEYVNVDYNSDENSIHYLWYDVTDDSGVIIEGIQASISGPNDSIYGDTQTFYKYYGEQVFLYDRFGNALKKGNTYRIRIKGFTSSLVYSLPYDFTIYIPSDKPSMFEWSMPKVTGGQYNMGAPEWNSFAQKINEFRIYKLGEGRQYIFSAVIPGDYFLSRYLNEVKTAIDEMVPTYVTTKSKYEEIKAADFNVFRDKLNSIT